MDNVPSLIIITVPNDDMFQITDPDPGCGLSDWDEVLADYSGLECGAIRRVLFSSSKVCST